MAGTFLGVVAPALKKSSDKPLAPAKRSKKQEYPLGIFYLLPAISCFKPLTGFQQQSTDFLFHGTSLFPHSQRR